MHKPPEVLLEGELDDIANEKKPDGYESLEAHRKKELSRLERGEHFIINRHNITELIRIYQDPQICKRNLTVYFDEDAGSGEGVQQEMFSVFWDHFVMFNCDGSSQFAIVVLPAMQPEDFVPVGRILTHGFVMCGSFPIQLAQASLHQALFGTVSDECAGISFDDAA